MNIIIIGATGGIGSALCTQLMAEGHTLFLSAQHAEPLHQKAQALGMASHPCDATQADDVEQLFHLAQNALGSIDGVAHCVGSVLLKPAHITKPHEWDNTLMTNLTSAFWVVRSAAKIMQKSGGSIVLCASAAGRIGLPNHDAIGAAKAGIIGLTQCSAATYAKKGIRINCVAPGMVETPLSASLLKNDAMRQASANMHPLGHIGQPNDVASAMAWLLNQNQGWLTGQVLGVDGGLATLKA